MDSFAYIDPSASHIVKILCVDACQKGLSVFITTLKHNGYVPYKRRAIGPFKETIMLHAPLHLLFKTQFAISVTTC